MHRLPLAVVAALASVAAVTPLHAAGITGTWHNPAGSVEVTMAPCGPRLCGTVVRANDKARDDAARGGTDQLVGTQLFRGLTADGPDHWTGEVFVPDIGQTVAGTLAQVGPNALEVSGCVIPGLVCQTQTWTRVAARR